MALFSLFLRVLALLAISVSIVLLSLMLRRKKYIITLLFLFSAGGLVCSILSMFVFSSRLSPHFFSAGYSAILVFIYLLLQTALMYIIALFHHALLSFPYERRGNAVWLIILFFDLILVVLFKILNIDVFQKIHLAVILIFCAYQVFLFIYRFKYIMKSPYNKYIYSYISVIGVFIIFVLLRSFNVLGIRDSVAVSYNIPGFLFIIAMNGILMVWFLKNKILRPGKSYPGTGSLMGNAAPDIDYNAIKDKGLSKREMEIVRYIMLEMSYKEIGEKLFISKLTVKTHVQNIYKKLEIKSQKGLKRILYGY